MRGIEREDLPVAQQHGLGVLPWSPLAGGRLSGRHLLDRIDEIVPPGTTVNDDADANQPPALTDPALRRRGRQPA